MQLDIRSDHPGEFRETEILDDERVHPGGGDPAELVLGGLHFAGKNERVHGDEAFHAVAVEVFHEFLEIRFDEIFRAQAGVELGQAEIDSIGPGSDGGAGAVPVSRRREQFGSHVGCERCHGGTES